jgi:hypothetical protein
LAATPRQLPDSDTTVSAVADVLRPIEWQALVSRDDVPSNWREMYAVLLYA